MTVSLNIVNGVVTPVYERTETDLADQERRAERREAEDRVPIVTVAALIRKAMRDKGYTQKHLAHLMGVPVVLVQKWQEGRATPREDNLWHVCEALSLDYLQCRKLSGIAPVAVAWVGSDRRHNAANYVKGGNE